jgi:general secretion pathway protein I
MFNLRPLYRQAQSKFLELSYGFTLLEVMVALAVMSIVLVSVYRMHSQSLVMNTAARFYTQAPILAQSKMVELEALSSSAFPEDSGDFGEEFPGYSWKASIADVTAEILGEVAEDLKRVDIAVSFNENQFIYNLRTYRFQRE